MGFNKETRSSRHIYADMIIAKAENMDLVVFYRESNRGSKIWHERRQQDKTNFNSRIDYFLCLPQHKEACLHWLNGGEIQDNFEDEWTDIKPHGGNFNWGDPDNLFMNEEFDLRIKPKKEKKWIAVQFSRGVYNTLFDSEEQAREQVPRADQFIEIEVEVDHEI